MGWIETLQELRNLPPPANELVPLLSTNAAFCIATLLVTDLSKKWSSWLDPYELGQLFVFGSFGVYMVMYWGYSLLLHVAETMVPSLVHFKIQPSTSTPWSELLKMAPLVVFNQLFIGIPMLKLYYELYYLRLGGSTDADTRASALSVPTIPTFFLTLFAHVLCTEAWFYTIHRFLHKNKFMYAKVHSIHHSYKAPSCLESVYVHPVEFALNSFTVFFIGPLVTGAPLIILFPWLWMVTFLQVHDHSGYWFPFLPKVLMHDYHHQKVDCCYGVLGLFDGILGTDGNFANFVTEQEGKNTKATNKEK